jgi:PKD repeat protein
VYFHQYFSLGGGGGGGTSPTAAFSATPTSGPAPLTVQFTDQSSGGPTAWQWDFQNDGTVDSTQQNPSFAFASPGTYSVKLTVSNVSGEDTTTKSGYITVATAGPTLTFTPTDDAFVRSNFPDENTGSLDNLRSFKKTAETDSYLKFTVSAVTGSVTSAKLRLYVVDASANAGTLYSVADTSWSESAITWNTKPPASGPIGPAGKATLGTWIEIDLGSAISGNGTYSLALVGTYSDAAWFSSKEGAHSPQLVVAQS